MKYPYQDQEIGFWEHCRECTELLLLDEDAAGCVCAQIQMDELYDDADRRLAESKEEGFQ